MQQFTFERDWNLKKKKKVYIFDIDNSFPPKVSRHQPPSPPTSSHAKKARDIFEAGLRFLLIRIERRVPRGPAPTCVVHMHRPYLKFPYTCSKPVPVRPFVWRESPSVVLRSCSRAIGVREIYARLPRPGQPSVHARTRSTGTGNTSCAFHTETRETRDYIRRVRVYDEGLPTIVSVWVWVWVIRPNHKIVIEVSDVATLLE